MKKETFALVNWLEAGNRHLALCKEFLSTAPESSLNTLSYKVPDTMLPDNDSIKLVFAGQYSAGKSTIMKILTGHKDIAIEAGITTDAAASYDWRGITVIDTPGIDTILRPNHDEITMNEIAAADLLVFVTTNELFDSHLAEHFRDLAISRHKAPEMMLVVNKMSRCADGNTIEAQNIIKEDLRKVLFPYSPEDLRITFTDAKSAEDSQDEEDVETAELLWEISGIDELTREMNNFVLEKGLMSRYTTSLYTLEQILQEAIAKQPGNDKDLAGAEEILLQRRSALVEAKNGILRSVDAEIQKVTSKVRDKGRKEADKINADAKEEVVNADLKLAQKEVEKLVEKLEQAIEIVIGRQIKNLDEKMRAIAESEFAKMLFPRLMIRIEQGSISPEALQKLKIMGDNSSELGKILIKNSYTAKYNSIYQLFKLDQYSGTNIHNAVKSVGKFLGYKFKPWEAVKWTRGIANIGRGVVIIGTLLTFVIQYKEDADAKKQEIELRENRSIIRSGFNEAAEEIEMYYDNTTKAYVANTITNEIGNVDAQLTELRNLHDKKDQIYTKLIEMLEETRSLIKQIHNGMAEKSI